MGVKIKTNNHERPVISDYELSPTEQAEQAEFDYLDWEALEHGEGSAEFMRYRGQLYDLGEFSTTYNTPWPLKGWDGYLSDSYFSGIVVRYAADLDYVIVGTFYAS